MLKTIFTNGVFDIIHSGHIDLLRTAKSLGSNLIVGINSDASTKRLKGKKRPINSEKDRYDVLKSIRYVDDVLIFHEDTPYELIKKVNPDIIVKGDDYRICDVVGNDLARVVLIKHNGNSTTKIINNIKELL